MSALPSSSVGGPSPGELPEPHPRHVPGGGRAFSLLEHLYADPAMARIWSEDRTIESWLRAEVALACAQAALGVIDSADASAISRSAVLANVDRTALWEQTRNVGYPILPLVRLIAAALPEGSNGRLHYGATTQDIMDTGLALQLRDSVARLDALVGAFGDALADQVRLHEGTVMAGRTHGQQAVPTTLGAKFAVLLGEVTRQRERLHELEPRVCVVSLFGAGGTSAALGECASQIRALMADELGLRPVHIPWHVARDGLAEFGAACASMSATCARLAREVIDLSRTEIGELREREGHLRGASSTMPQKANPISSEAVVGMSVAAGSLTSGLFRMMEAGHERAAGEWQAEWQIVPQLAGLAAGCLVLSGDIVRGVQAFPEAMSSNLETHGGMVMAEAYMMRLAPDLGREVAHDVVYAAVHLARQDKLSLTDAISRLTSHPVPVADPQSYLGQAREICHESLSLWEQ